MSDRITATGTAMARLRAKCIGRYRLKAVPGHPEDLVQIGDERQGMSIVYGCQAVRVRLHHGREWLAFLDLPRGRELDAATVRRIFDALDPHFSWTPRGFPIVHGGGQPTAGSLLDPKLAALAARVSHIKERP